MTWIACGPENVVVVKFPVWNGLITKPEGASVIVATLVANPGALAVTCTVPLLSRAWMNSGVVELLAPATMGSVTCLVPRAVPLVDSTSSAGVGAAHRHGHAARGRRRLQADARLYLKIAADGLIE